MPTFEPSAPLNAGHQASLDENLFFGKSAQLGRLVPFCRVTQTTGKLSNFWRVTMTNWNRHLAEFNSSQIQTHSNSLNFNLKISI